MSPVKEDGGIQTVPRLRTPQSDPPETTMKSGKPKNPRPLYRADKPFCIMCVKVLSHQGRFEAEVV